MSSFGLLVSNTVSSFIIGCHTLFGISYITLDKNALVFLRKHPGFEGGCEAIFQHSTSFHRNEKRGSLNASPLFVNGLSYLEKETDTYALK